MSKIKPDYFILAFITAILLMVDSTFTLYAVEQGYGVEANPLLNWGDLNLILAVRDLCGTLGLVFLAVVTTSRSHQRAARIASAGIWVLFGTYTLVAVYHVLGFILNSQ